MEQANLDFRAAENEPTGPLKIGLAILWAVRKLEDDVGKRIKKDRIRTDLSKLC